MHPKYRLHEPSRTGGCDRLFMPGSPARLGGYGHPYCPECWDNFDKRPPAYRSGEAKYPWRCGQVWVPATELWEAMESWAAGEAYWKNDFRLRGDESKRGPVAPWNLEVKTYLTGVEVGDAEPTWGQPLDSPPEILHLACQRAGLL